MITDDQCLYRVHNEYGEVYPATLSAGYVLVRAMVSQGIRAHLCQPYLSDVRDHTGRRVQAYRTVTL